MKRLIAILLLLAALTSVSTGVCDEYGVFILCNPNTNVNVRSSPKKGTSVVGWIDFGDEVLTDGEKRNGFLHVFTSGEMDGWIHSGYVVEDEPRKVERAWANVAATGRVMTYKRIGGQKNGWVEIGTQVRVYAISEEWAVTNRGYIRTKYLEVWYE